MFARVLLNLLRHKIISFLCVCVFYRTRRSNRDRDSKLDRYRDDYRYKDEDRYPEDDDDRDRYGYDSSKGRYQRYDHKRHPDTDKRGGREDSDRRGQGSQNNRTRDVRDGREMTKSREMKVSRDTVREGRDGRSRPSDSGRERERDRDYGDSRDSRSGKESKSFKAQGGRDSKSHDRDRDWDKKESRWNEHDDDSTDSLEPPR